MQNLLDAEQPIYNIEEEIFNLHEVVVQKNPNNDLNSKLISMGNKVNSLSRFYRQLDLNSLNAVRIGMFSSGTTKESKTLCWRSKLSIVKEILELENQFSYLQSKKIFIMVSPNHSFGLVPALLTTRKLTNKVYLFTGKITFEVLKHFFSIKPEIIFAVPSHLRLIAEWVEKKGRDLIFLKQIIYAGAVLHESLIQFFQNLGVRLTSVYGTTQTGVIAIQQDVPLTRPENCGLVLNNQRVLISDKSEIIVKSENNERFATGDRGYFLGNELIVERRLDNIIFKNGNKIDLVLLEEIIKNATSIKEVKIHFEKNINNSHEIICNLPKKYESSHYALFEKLKSLVPSYAIPSKFYYN